MQKGFPFYVLTVWVMEKPPLFQFWIPLTTRNECLVSHINWSTWSSIILNFRMLSPARVKSWSNLLPVFSGFFFFFPILVLRFLPGYWKRILKSFLNQKHKNTSVQDMSKISPDPSFLKILLIFCLSSGFSLINASRTDFLALFFSQYHCNAS